MRDICEECERYTGINEMIWWLWYGNTCRTHSSASRRWPATLRQIQRAWKSHLGLWLAFRKQYSGCWYRKLHVRYCRDVWFYRIRVREYWCEWMRDGSWKAESRTVFRPRQDLISRYDYLTFHQRSYDLPCYQSDTGNIHYVIVATVCSGLMNLVTWVEVLSTSLAESGQDRRMISVEHSGDIM